MPAKTKSYETSIAEDAVAAAIEKRIGGRPEFFESSNNGVIAIANLGSDSQKIDWQELAAELARETGVGVLCIVERCDWSFNDKPDEEATWISFDVPGLNPEYRDDDHRNEISPVTPENAPPQADFDKLKKARKVADGYIAELHGKKDKLSSAKGAKATAPATIQKEIDAMEELRDNLAVEDREAVGAVIDLEFGRAIEILERETASPTP